MTLVTADIGGVAADDAILEAAQSAACPEPIVGDYNNLYFLEDHTKTMAQQQRFQRRVSRPARLESYHGRPSHVYPQLERYSTASLIYKILPRFQIGDTQCM